MQSIFPLSDRISAFIRLGNRLSELEGDEKQALFQQAQNQNAWFTPQSLEQALKGIQVLLDAQALEKWVTNYSFSETDQPQQIGLMLAGNIPGVGFHDILAVLIAGHSACIKLSSQDSALPLWLLTQLKAIEPRFSDRIHLEELLKNKQAYIATGSDNSARYFNYYFGKYPHLIRSNRTSVAILQGDESKADLQALGKDIFDYFGRGCRNVSHLLLPKDFELNRFFEGIVSYSEVINNKKYGNNYDYNKAIHLMNLVPFLDNNFMLLMEHEQLQAPLSMVYYHYYSNEEEVKNYLEVHKEQLQCIVGLEHLPFGSTQEPQIKEYADGIDTMQWLSNHL